MTYLLTSLTKPWYCKVWLEPAQTSSNAKPTGPHVAVDTFGWRSDLLIACWQQHKDSQRDYPVHGNPTSVCTDNLEFQTVCLFTLNGYESQLVPTTIIRWHVYFSCGWIIDQCIGQTSSAFDLHWTLRFPSFQPRDLARDGMNDISPNTLIEARCYLILHDSDDSTESWYNGRIEVLRVQYCILARTIFSASL